MTGQEKYRLLRLVTENYKRIVAADVTPARNTVVVTGRNEQGKSSLLDSIAAALGGKKQVAEVPLHKGAESGQILCVLGDTTPQLLVKRTFEATGKTLLEITSAEGYKAPSPQAILDTLASHLTFDPLAWLRKPADEQQAMLRKLVGLDFTELDKQHATLYSERTAVNRLAKSLTSQAQGVVVSPDTPEAEVSIMDLMVEQKRRRNHNATNQKERDKASAFDRRVADAERKVAELNATIGDLEWQLADTRKALESAETALSGEKAQADAQRSTVAVLEDQNVDEVDGQILNAQTTNANVAKRKQKADLEAQAAAQVEKAKALTATMESIEADKRTRMMRAEWPIPGLGIGDKGVLFNGLPLSQASSAEAVAISFSIAAALHPNLKIALIRDGSLLDEQHLELISKIAAEYDFQVWIEMVGDSAGPCGILIEDGTVVQAAPANAPLPGQKEMF